MQGHRTNTKFGSGGRRREQVIGLGQSHDQDFLGKGKAGQGEQFRNG